MIRRKNINCSQIRSTSIDNKGVFQHSYDNSRKQKYNYLAHGLQNHNQNVIDKDLSRISQRSRYKIDNLHDEYFKGINGSETLLRKNQLYRGIVGETHFDQNCEAKYKVRNQRGNRLYHCEQLLKSSETTLRQSSLNNKLSKTPPNIQSQTTKTIRKADQSCTCSTSLNKDERASGSSRYKSKQVTQVKDRLISNEDDLDAKYEAIWKANQNDRDRSFQNVQRDEFRLRSGAIQNGVIINTRENILRNRRKEQTKEEQREYPSRGEARTILNYYSSSDQYQKRDQNSVLKQKIPIECLDINKSSTPLTRSRKLDCTLKPDLLGYVPLIPECTKSVPLPCDQRNALRHQTDVRLRMVEEFSSRISMRILELTTSLQEMRHKRR